MGPDLAIRARTVHGHTKGAHAPDRPSVASAILASARAGYGYSYLVDALIKTPF